MTKSLLLNCTFSLFCILCVPASFAQDHTQMALPDGAQARLGKGSIKWGYRVFTRWRSAGGGQ